ncbi:hypothetical protein [Duganella margarita]|nr:hypothetical protein [Duganella margarita]
MSTALQIKVVTLLGYVALSTALVLMLADEEMQGAATAMFYALLR